MKDLPTDLPARLCIAAVLPRADVRDAFISNKAPSLADLAPGATVGTSSLRRQAQVKRLRPDLRVIDFRGNVETRLRKLEAGEMDATILALAGMKRLGLEKRATRIMEVAEFLPAAGQGAIAIETREDNARVRDVLAKIDHADTSTTLACERAFLAVLDGTCKTPIGGFAKISGDTIHLRGLLAHPDGRPSVAHELRGARTDAVKIGTEAGHYIKRTAPAGLLA
jgi:hydroxymethylbilane synthase